MSKNFGNTERRQSCSQGSCWDPKKQGRMKHQKKERKKTPPFPLLGHKFHFFCSQPCAATPPHPHLTTFNLLPFSLAVPFFFFQRRFEVLNPGKWALDNGLGRRNARQRGDFFLFFTFLLVISNFLNPRFPRLIVVVVFVFFNLLCVFRVCLDNHVFVSVGFQKRVPHPYLRRSVLVSVCYS